MADSNNLSGLSSKDDERPVPWSVVGLDFFSTYPAIDLSSLWKEKMELEEVSWLSREKSRMVHLHKQHSTREDLRSILLHLGLRIHHSICTRVEYFLEFLVKANKFLIKNTWETLTHYGMMIFD